MYTTTRSFILRQGNLPRLPRVIDKPFTISQARRLNHTATDYSHIQNPSPPRLQP